VHATRLGSAPLLAGSHRWERDVLEHGQAVEQIEELEDDPDPFAPHLCQVVIAHVLDMQAFEHDLSVVGRVEPGDQIEHGRLPAPRWPHHCDELAGTHGEVKPSQGSYRRMIGLERLADCSELENESIGHAIHLSTSTYK